MDDWAWEQLQPWLASARAACRRAVLRHQRPDARPTRSPAAAREHLRHTAAQRRRLATIRAAPAPARPRRRDGPRRRPAIVIQRQLGHANLGITSIYLQGIDNAEIIDTVHARRAPTIPASAGLR